MAGGRGPAPKDPAQRRRRNVDPHPQQELRTDGRTRGPALPAAAGLLDAEEWHPQTRAWWGWWRKSAQAQMFTPLDWAFLLDTALLHHAYWSGKLDVASELRLRVAKFGATLEDRLRLRIAVDRLASVDPTEPPGGGGPGPAAVASIDARRTRLTG